jgi:EAL domain-containing protein (putative c-di-GMP-specific phosphodiesterase class I)
LKAHSIGGDSAARVEEGRFSVLHAAGYRVDELIGQVERLARSADPAGKGLHVEASTTVMDVADVTEEDLAKGLIHAIHRFSAKDANIRDMAANMGHMVQDAVRELAKLKQVIEKAEFQVVLHPIVDVMSGRIHHYEALCRFERDLAGSPFNTILFAEETGLIHEFDLAMVTKVLDWLCNQPLDDEANVAVNVSGYSIGEPRYVDALMALLEANPWARGRLMFEITESSRMTDLKAANEFIQELRQRDFMVSLDDFGAGAASFQYLSVLEVDVVKLDGSAVRNAQKAQKGRAFLSALTELCRRMGIETIAEMIDAPEMLDFVRECGCNYVQGYLFGKPSRDVGDFKPLPQAHLFKRR